MKADNYSGQIDRMLVGLYGQACAPREFRNVAIFGSLGFALELRDDLTECLYVRVLCDGNGNKNARRRA